MRFVSPIVPISLDTDPPNTEEGTLYYNNILKTYRVYVDGVWRSVVHSADILEYFQENIEILGDESTESVTLNPPDIEKNTVYYITSASTSYINLPNYMQEFINEGGSFTIVRAGAGEIQINSASGVTLLSPSDIYLTSVGDSVVLTKINSEKWIMQGEFRDLY